MRDMSGRVFADLASVKVTSELVCFVIIIVLTIFPDKCLAHAAKKALRACGVEDRAAVATPARLWAAGMMKAGDWLD